MRYPSIDQLVSKAKSKYRLVVGTAKRARDISKGAKVLIDNPNSKKNIGIALEEIYQDKIIIQDE
ncbi:MAG TPA: DNA-directed RNA polymerase subunit omega [Acholeplasmataceae bacterium]|nr:DNA-directed RNA polymerase subunit omega [Acholeplasmataceae bacterium]